MAALPADTTRPGRGAGPPGGALLSQLRSPCALHPGKLWDSSHRVIRDQHGGFGAGRQ